MAALAAFVPAGLSAQSAGPLAGASDVQFSYGEDAPYREGLLKYYATDIEDAQAVGAQAQLGVATVDVNGDGITEVAAKLESSLYCGSGGCPVTLMQYTSQGWVEVLKINLQNLALGQNKTAGYHDLIVNGANVWRWNGTGYSFSETAK